MAILRKELIFLLIFSKNIKLFLKIITYLILQFNFSDEAISENEENK